MTNHSTFIGAMLGCALNAVTPGEPPAAGPAPARPNYSRLRFNEDWSVLRDPAASAPADFWDPIKYVPLRDDGEVWASFGGSTRLRVEDWSSFAFNEDLDDTFALWRLLLHADLHVGENLRFFIEGKSALATERDLPGGRRTTDVDTLALEQAFADLVFHGGNGDALTIRPGRQALAFGKERLVSPQDWSNTLRRWDGVSVIARTNLWIIHGFFTQFVPTRKYEFNESSEDELFFGIYATGKLTEHFGLDLYYLGLDREAATFNFTRGDELRHTLGGRVFGTCPDWRFDYDFEAAHQFGEVGDLDGDVQAWMVGSEIGWRPSPKPNSPRLFAGFDYASGDDVPGFDVQTFNQLYPDGHAFLGYADLFGRQNIVAVHAGISVTPLERLTATVSGHLFRRASDNDAVYDADGGVLRSFIGSAPRKVASEVDFTLKYAFDQHLAGLLGYSMVFPRDFIEETGPADDVQFIYLQLEYTF